MSDGAMIFNRWSKALFGWRRMSLFFTLNTSCNGKAFYIPIIEFSATVSIGLPLTEPLLCPICRNISFNAPWDSSSKEVSMNVIYYIIHLMHMAWQYSLNTILVRKNGIRVNKEKGNYSMHFHSLETQG
jgi:hypothetical protein